MKKILIVDEEKISVSGTIFKIETSIKNVQIITKKTCSEADEFLKSESVSVIILDMMIPKGSMTFPKERIDFRYGIDLLITWRNENISVPIICYTIINNDDDLERQIKEHGGVYLCKLSEGSENQLVDILTKYL